MSEPDRDGPSELEAHLAGRESHLEDLVLDLIGFDTQNPPGETAAAVTYVEEYLEAAGVDTETIASERDKPNLVAEIPGRSDTTLVWNGHLDTVPFDRAGWEYDPLGEVDGDRIYGRGATDMKGPLASMLEVFRAFAETGVEPPVTLSLAVVSDEEVPSDAGLATLLDNDAIDADACVIGETTCERGRFSLTVADKGSIWLSLRARGDGAHGSRPMVGTNAIDALYHAVEDLRESLRERSCPPNPDLDPVLEESIAYYSPTIGEAAAEDLFRHPTVNLGRMSGGSAINAVPEEASAGLDVRFPAGIDTEDVLADIEECLDRHDGVEIADVSLSVGTFESPTAPIVRATETTASEVLGERVFLRSATGGGDAKRLRNAGISTVEFGVGTETVHARDEFITREALSRNISIFARLPYRLAEILEAATS